MSVLQPVKNVNLLSKGHSVWKRTFCFNGEQLSRTLAAAVSEGPKVASKGDAECAEQRAGPEAL